MDLNQLVNELIEVSRSGTRVPGFRGKTMIDADRLGGLLSELQNNMPSGVQEAQTIITQKDSIITQAQMEASRIIDEARNSAAQMSNAASAEQQEKVSDSEVLRVASNKGDEIVTAGGIVGKVNKVEEDFVILQVSKEVEMRLQKTAVGATLPKGTIKSLDES